MTFSQESRKLEKIFNDIKTNKTALDNRKNEQLLLNFFKTTIKPHYTLSDTGWLSKAPDNNDLKTINPGDPLPESLSISYTDELEIPDILLPYIDVFALIKTPPDSVLTSYNKYSTENYEGDYIEVRGNGSLIYKGEYPVIGGGAITEAQLGTVAPEANTRKIFQVTVNHTDPDSGDEFVTSGILEGIFYQDNERECEKETDPGPPPEFTTITIRDTFSARWYLDHEHEISDFTASGFTAIGDFTEQTFTSGTPDCAVDTTTTENVEQTISFSSVENYFLYIRGTQFNITQGTFVGFSGTIKEVNGEGITSYDLLQLNGYRVYYSSNRAFEFEVGNAGDLILTNLPSDAGGISLPYSSISFERNLGDLSSILETEVTEDIFLQSSSGNIVNGNPIRQDVALFKMQDGNASNFPYYYLKIGLGATILAPATEDDPNPHIDTQVDSYSIDGSSYSRSSNVDGSVSEAFVTAGQDVQYRLMIVVKNPYWFQEVRKYDITQ